MAQIQKETDFDIRPRGTINNLLKTTQKGYEDINQGSLVWCMIHGNIVHISRVFVPKLLTALRAENIIQNL